MAPVTTHKSSSGVILHWKNETKSLYIQDQTLIGRQIEGFYDAKVMTLKVYS